MCCQTWHKAGKLQGPKVSETGWRLHPYPTPPPFEKGTELGVGHCSLAAAAQLNIDLARSLGSVAKFDCTQSRPCSKSCSRPLVVHIWRPSPCPGVTGQPPFMSTLGSARHCKEQRWSGTTSTAQAGASLVGLGCGLASSHSGGDCWPWPCPTSTCFVHILDQSPASFPRAPTAWPEDRRAGTERLRASLSCFCREHATS